MPAQPAPETPSAYPLLSGMGMISGRLCGFPARCLVALALLAIALLAPAQSFPGLVSGAKSSATQPAPAADPLKRTTPRSSIVSFLEACHSRNYTLASQYLDLRRIRPDQRTTQGRELARELTELLDRDPKFEVEDLSNSPQGNLAAGLPPGFENLDSFDVNGKNVLLQMQRANQGGVPVWLVSADSVTHIPQLNALTHESAIEKKLPQVLVTHDFIGTPLWVWMALVLLALILSLISRLLSRIVIALVTPLAKRYSKSIQAYRLEAFMEPLRLLLSIAVFRVCMEAIAPSALVRDYLLKLLTLLFIMGATSLIMRLVDVVSDHAISRLDTRQRALSYSVFPLFVRIVKILIFCIAVLFVLSQWGYSTSTILAGVGVGGIAVALAAQKTIENLFGSFSVITDRPVLVGDFCQFGTQNGTVEDIGLRSTRIRTLDRTLVTIPNSVFSTMTLENYSRRDRFWFHPTLHLRRDSTADQIRDMLESVTKLLQEHPKLSASGVPVRFTKILNESYDLEIFAYVLTTDNDEFLKIQAELLLEIIQTAARLKIGLAVPFQESIGAQHAAHEPEPDKHAYQSERTISK